MSPQIVPMLQADHFNSHEMIAAARLARVVEQDKS
jgi:hypothetical protein